MIPLSPKEENGFSGIEVAIVIAVLSIFSAVAIPAFNCVRRRAISTAAQETIRQIKEECETNYIYGIDKFTSTNPDKYQISSSGSNSCSEGTVTLTPEDTNLYPTYLYKFAGSELSYNFKGQTGTSFVACNKLICGDEGTKKKINLDYPFVVKDAFLERECSAYVIVKADSWEEGEANSQKLGGNLVTLNDVEEYVWLQKNLWGNNILLRESGFEEKDIDVLSMYFVGLNDVNEEGKYEWSSGQESEWNNNEQLIHRQNWLAQQHMANSHDYFVVHSTDLGFQGYVNEDYRPDLYNTKGVGALTWVDNESSFYKGWNSPHYGVAEIPICN